MESEFEKIQQEILETEKVCKVSIDLIQTNQKQLDKILLKLNERDERTIDGMGIKPSLKADVNKNIQDWLDEEKNIDLEHDTELYNYLKNFFDVKDSELKLGELHRSRFELEFYRAALKIHLQSLEEEIDELKVKAFANYQVESKPWLYGEDEEEVDENDDPDAPLLAQMVPAPQTVHDTQTLLMNHLERKLINFLKKVFSDHESWYTDFIHDKIKEGIRYRNKKDPHVNINELEKIQSLELLEKLMFPDYQLIITGNRDNYTDLFQNILGHYRAIDERLIELSKSRNKIYHNTTLVGIEDTQFTQNCEYFGIILDEYLGITDSK